jgi:hypothetical protein
MKKEEFSKKLKEKIIWLKTHKIFPITWNFVICRILSFLRMKLFWSR